MPRHLTRSAALDLLGINLDTDQIARAVTPPAMPVPARRVLGLLDLRAGLVWYIAMGEATTPEGACSIAALATSGANGVTYAKAVAIGPDDDGYAVYDASEAVAQRPDAGDSERLHLLSLPPLGLFRRVERKVDPLRAWPV